MESTAKVPKNSTEEQTVLQCCIVLNVLATNHL